MPSTNRNQKRTRPAQHTHPTKPTAVPADRYAPQVWGQRASTTAEDITCPSGQLALVRRPGVEGLANAGVLEDVDTLSSLVNEKHIKRVRGGDKVDAAELLKDVKNLEKIMQVVDKIVIWTVQQPAIEMTPDCRSCGETFVYHLWNKVDHDADVELKDNVVYVHQIDTEDKMFIVNYAVGGTRDWERFRKQSQDLVADVHNGEDVERAAE